MRLIKINVCHKATVSLAGLFQVCALRPCRFPDLMSAFNLHHLTGAYHRWSGPMFRSKEDLSLFVSLVTI